MMDSLDFSEEEILEQLAVLGYRNIPKHRLQEFKKDLDKLILHPEFRHLASPPQISSTKPLKPASARPSPPAVTREKVSLCFGDGFFLHANQSGHQRQVLTPCHNREYGQGEGLPDSYAQHSVAPKLQPAVGGPSRLQAESEAEPDSRLRPPLDDSYLSCSDSLGRRLIKRKVFRKYGGQSLICEESIYSENSDITSSLEERLADLRLTTSPRRDPESDEEDEEDEEEQQEQCSDSRSDSRSDGISVDAFETYFRSMTHTRSDVGNRPKPKSFIRPVASQPAVKKTDPVTKYFQYKQIWEMFKLPGQREHRALRQEIRDRLAYQPPPPKPRRVYVPNTYEVPTEKKRSALRWEVRNDLANGFVPCKVSYRY
ncbi:centriolar and ciliogenesis-associated protein HYLS1 [Nelusetta ayraudi]|uniref:centriolar and ciliogenesis-associated protein HYLS1 n=1 Tax=Nelusetta ayraudi TaxID=303726 RepID=UPI003F72FABB